MIFLLLPIYLFGVGVAVVVLLVVCGAVTLRGKQLCLRGRFESQARYLLRNVMLSPDDIEKALSMFDDIRDTLRRRWPGTEVFPYGSLTTGIALTYSDGDCLALVPHYNWTTDEDLAEDLFRQQPDLYSNLYTYPPTYSPTDEYYNYTLIKFYHNSTGRYCDVTFTFIRGFQSSRVFDYIIKLDERIMPLIGVIKFWSKVHQIAGPNLLSSFGVYSLIIFYLQQKAMAPPIFLLQKDTKSRVFVEWDMSFQEIPYNSTNKESLYQLLGGFFKYFSKFNFKDYIVSPFVGRPVRRSDFADINNIPDEFTLYKAYIMQNDAIPLQIDTDLCIQEIFLHYVNAARKVPGEHVSKIITHINFAARMFDELPSEGFLRAILTKDAHNELLVRNNEISVNQGSELKDCMN